MARRLPIAVLGLVLAAWLAAPALPVERLRPRAVDFTQRLADVPRAGGTAAGARVLTRELRAPGRFDLVGFAWDDDRDLRIDMRVRREGEGWGRWVAVGSADSAPGRSDPVWTGGADAYQLSLSRRPEGLRAHFVNVTGTRTAADRAGALVRRSVRSAVLALAGDASAGSASEAPDMVARETWERGECPPRRAPEHGEVQFGVVHHTASAGDYGPEDSAAIVLAICRYHRNANGWNDIGYNFLVDRFGRVFEGRAGGIDQPVVGAHAQGYNATSTGVAHLGTFSDVPDTHEAIQATARLLAWKLGVHGVPATGRVTVRSGGGGANRHPAGEPVAFERIAGHRDGNRTDCPGDALFGQLPEIRRLAHHHQAGAAAAGPRHPSKLQVARARVLRADRRLDLLAPISRRAGGVVRGSLRAAGRTRRFRARIDSERGRVRLRRSLPAAQARLGTGIVTLRYAGNDRTRPQVVRLRAAPRRARLAVVRPRLTDGRLRARGTVARRARGVVRLQLDYVVDGRHRVVDLRAPIAGGRWRLDERLPSATVAEIERRDGTVHSSIQYTGHLPTRTRGEMRSLQVLGAR